jgi:hypothetical protein
MIYSTRKFGKIKVDTIEELDCLLKENLNNYNSPSKELIKWFNTNKYTCLNNSELKKIFTFVYAKPHKYNRFLKTPQCVEFYYMRGFSESEAIIKVKKNIEKNKKSIKKTIENMSEIEKQKKYDNSSLSYFKEKYNNLSESEILEKYNNLNLRKIQNSFKNTKEFWDNSGLSENEIKNNISKHQKEISDMFTKLKNENPLKYDNTFNTKIEYWIKKGFSKDDAKFKLSERQTTFSKDICIKKYGYDDGINIFNLRQKKWQETLNSKSFEEIRIKKGNGSHKMLRFKHNKDLANEIGILYYIKFQNKYETFYKIGITKNTIKKRWGNTHKGYKISIIYSYKDIMYNCYLFEQKILKLFDDVRFRTSIGTEFFNKDIKINDDIINNLKKELISYEEFIKN